MHADASEAGGYSCRAAFITVNADAAVPALILEPARGDHDATAPGSRMALEDLPSLTAVSGARDRVSGWLVLTGRESDRVDVLTRVGDVRQVFGGTCALADDWLDEVERTGCCALLAGTLGLSTTPSAAPNPEEVAHAVATAAAAGCVRGGLVPVYLPAYPRSRRAWPGVVHRPQQQGWHRNTGPLQRPSGVSFGFDATDELVDVVARVQAEGRGKSYAWIRQRLLVDLLPYELNLMPGVLDYLAEDLASRSRGLPGAMRRWARARRRSIRTAGLLLRAVVAFIGRRPQPHWHLFGMHVVDTSGWGAPAEVALDPWAGDLVAMDGTDDIIVWLGPQQQGPSVVAYYGDYRLGVLTGDDSFYRSILGEPGHADVRVITEAVRSRAADGSWRLHVRAPAPEATLSSARSTCRRRACRRPRSCRPGTRRSRRGRSRPGTCRHRRSRR